MAPYFLSLSADAIDAAILSALERLARFLNVERAILGEFAEDGEVIVRRSWASSGFTRIPEGATLGDFLPHVFQLVRQGYDASIADTARLSRAISPRANSLAMRGVRSAPLRVAGSSLIRLIHTSARRCRVRWMNKTHRRLFATSESRKGTIGPFGQTDSLSSHSGVRHGICVSARVKRGNPRER